MRNPNTKQIISVFKDKDGIWRDEVEWEADKVRNGPYLMLSAHFGR